MISNFLSRRRSNESDSSANRRISEESAHYRVHSKLSKSSGDREPSTPANELQLAQKVLQDARSQRKAAKYSQRSKLLSGEEEYRKARNLAAFESLPKLYKNSTLDSKKSKERSTTKKKEARRNSVEETYRRTLLKEFERRSSACIVKKDDDAPRKSLFPQQKSLSSRQLTLKKNKDKDDKKVSKIMNELKIHHCILETYYKSKKENENQQEQNKDRSINNLIETFLDSYEEVMSMTNRQETRNSRRGSDSTESINSTISCNSCSRIPGRNMVEFDRAQATSRGAPPPLPKSETKKRVSFGLPSTLTESQEDKKRGSAGGEIKGILRKNSFIYKQSLTNKYAS